MGHLTGEWACASLGSPLVFGGCFSKEKRRSEKRRRMTPGSERETNGGEVMEGKAAASEVSKTQTSERRKKGRQAQPIRRGMKAELMHCLPVEGTVLIQCA